MNTRLFGRSLSLIILTLVASPMLMLTGCDSEGTRPDVVAKDGVRVAYSGSLALELSSVVDTAAFVAKIADKRVIYVGEKHDRYEQHLNQLAVIKGLYAQNPNMAIGLEQFQRPFQHVLDDFVARRIDTVTMLKQSEWFVRWRFDYRLYAPILDFARQEGIPLLALNADKDITQQISESGLWSLSADQRLQIAQDIDRSDKDYIESLNQVFRLHPGWEKKNFDRFVDVQLVWDETMAETVVDYLKSYPKRRVVVLAGSGHIAYRSGIPDRVARRMEVAQVTVIQDVQSATELTTNIADWILMPEPKTLPPSGKMGIIMTDESRGVRIEDVVASSGAEQAGLQSGDVIVGMNEKTITDTSDVRIQLYEKSPGDTVKVQVLRAEKVVDIQVVLKGLK